MKTAKDKGIFITLDVVPHKIFRQSLNPDYKEALSLADGVILAIGTARRILKDFNESEDTLCEKLLQSYKFIIVIFDMGENLTIASRNNIQKLSTEHSKAKNKLGYLDKYFAKHLLGFMMNK